MDEAIDSIRRAITRASEDRRQGEHHARARIDQLARTAHRCEQLEATLNGWLAASTDAPISAQQPTSTRVRSDQARDGA